MNPVAIAQLLVQLLPFGVKFAGAVIELLHKTNPTLADWQLALSYAHTPFGEGLQEGAIQPDPPA